VFATSCRKLPFKAFAEQGALAVDLVKDALKARRGAVALRAILDEAEPSEATVSPWA
jgi:hypothetical protein